MSLCESFREIALCKVNMGDTVQFWVDNWDLGFFNVMFPQLYSFVRNSNISVQKFLSQTAHQNFTTPLSVISSKQLQELAGLVMAVQADQNIPD